MFEKEYKVELGKLCKALRCDKSLKEIAQSIEVTPMTVLNIENGVAISKKSITKLLRLYGLDYHEIEEYVDTCKNKIIELTTYILTNENNLLEEATTDLLSMQSKYFDVFFKYDIETLLILIPHILANTKYSSYECTRIKMFIDDISIAILRDYTMISIKRQEPVENSNDMKKNATEVLSLLENNAINTKVKGLAYLFVSRMYFNLNDKFKTIYYANKSIDIFEDKKSMKRLISSKNVVSGMLILCNDFSTAESMLMDIINDSHTFKLDEYSRIAESNLLWMYYYQEQYEKVIRFMNCLSSHHILSKSDKFVYLWSLFMSGKSELAVIELNKFGFNSDDGGKMEALYSIIKNGFSTENEIELLNYLKLISEEDRFEKFECLSILVEYYRQTGNYAKAFEYLRVQQNVFCS